MMGYYDARPFESLNDLRWYANNGFDDVITQYLVYFPLVSSSNLLQSDPEQLVQTMATALQNRSFTQLKDSEKMLMQAFITSSIYSVGSHQFWAELYETRNLVWPFRKEMFNDEVIEWWENHTNELVVFIAKQGAHNPDFDWSDRDIDKLARQISSRAESLCHGLSQDDCELLLNHVDQFSLLGHDKTTSESGGTLLNSAVSILMKSPRLLAMKSSIE